jgi:ACS family hexuronate transporter-like MFS transporter
VFSLVYAVIAPVAGYFIDRIGLNLGIAISMSVWSLAGMVTSATRTFSGLLLSRAVLGLGEAAGIPATGKTNGLYLAPKELAFGTALNQVGITIGSVAAPLVVATLAPVYGWRSTFVFAGALGFLWIPLWFAVAHKVPARTQQQTAALATPAKRILADRRLWSLALANALVMTLYTLWTNWTTIYFVQQFGLTEAQANRQFAWVPPLFATLGAFAGGWLTYRFMHKGASVWNARMRTCRIAAAILLTTAAVPFMPTPLLAVAAISMSFFWCVAISGNLYAMPIDFLGASNAAFGVSLITASFGLMQTFLSPLIGWMVDTFGFSGVCIAMAMLPLAGVAVLSRTRPLTDESRTA